MYCLLFICWLTCSGGFAIILQPQGRSPHSLIIKKGHANEVHFCNNAGLPRENVHWSCSIKSDVFKQFKSREKPSWRTTKRCKKSLILLAARTSELISSQLELRWDLSHVKFGIGAPKRTPNRHCPVLPAVVHLAHSSPASSLVWQSSYLKKTLIYVFIQGCVRGGLPLSLLRPSL